MTHQNLSSQVKPRDEFTQHNSANLQLIREAASRTNQLPPQNSEYSRVSIMVGSALSSTGDLEQSERFFTQALNNAKKETEKALAHFNLFQIQLRRQAYTDALKNLQAAIAIEPQLYALHDIRKYPLERLLGAGGMGCVFLCQNHNRLIRQEQVVVKCFWENIKGTLDEVFKEPFAMRNIAGNYIPEPLDFGYVDVFKQERAYFVTEYINDAIDGEAWLEKYGSMDLETVISIGLQIAEGLQIAHNAGIYHLDLKPANILLLKQEVSKASKTSDVSISVKIIDFGLSQVATSLRQEALEQQNRSGLSAYGQAIFGTLDYAPPEQQGFTQYGKPSATSDIFAFGATMYRLLTSANPRRFSERKLPDVPALRELLFDCVEENPTHRPQSVRQLLSRLKEIEAQTQVVETQTEATHTKGSNERKESLAKVPEQPVPHETQTLRYTNNGDGTVTDNNTGLIWLKKANGFKPQNWVMAQRSVAKLAHGQCGLNDNSKAGDWRLPTKDEWEAMVDKKYKNPVLCNTAGTDKWTEGEIFSDVQTHYYWSSTQRGESRAWFVLLYDGFIGSEKLTKVFHLWPVRDGNTKENYKDC